MQKDNIDNPKDEIENVIEEYINTRTKIDELEQKIHKHFDQKKLKNLIIKMALSRAGRIMISPSKRANSTQNEPVPTAQYVSR